MSTLADLARAYAAAKREAEMLEARELTLREQVAHAALLATKAHEAKRAARDALLAAAEGGVP